MEQRIVSTTGSYGALTVVSPMMFGEEPKNQDRARWYEPGLIGCVCDGVTSSPHSAQAAELVVSFAPILFEGNAHERVRTVCELLVAHRRQFQATPLALSKDTPEVMQAMLMEALRDKQAISYQTTIAAVRLRPGASDVGIDILRCGDSAVLAFSDDGELLYSSLTHPREDKAKRRRAFLSGGLTFGPGSQILVRVEGSLDRHEQKARVSGINERHYKNWLVCTPVDTCSGGQTESTEPSGALVVTSRDTLLVPRYLYGRQLESQGQEYRCLDYSSTIRILPAAPRAPGDGISHRGSFTEVLPDHVYSGCYDYVEDRFPQRTHFVLGSDGFYSAFATASHMWAWLQEYCIVRADTEQQQRRLEELHSRLHSNSGDDDVSFVWMYPTVSPVPDPDPIEVEKE